MVPIDAILDIFKEIWDIFSEVVSIFTDIASAVFDILTIPFDSTFGGLKDMISAIGSVIKFVVEVIVTPLKVVLGFLKLIKSFVVAVHEFIMHPFDSIVKAIGVVGSAISFVGDMVESAASMIGRVADAIAHPVDTVVDTVSEYVPDIVKHPIDTIASYLPSFSEGLSYVPYDGMPATLHKGEAVLTADQASMIRPDGGINPYSDTQDKMLNVMEELLDVQTEYNKDSLAYFADATESDDWAKFNTTSDDLTNSFIGRSSSGHAGGIGRIGSKGSRGRSGGLLDSIGSSIKGAFNSVKSLLGFGGSSGGNASKSSATASYGGGGESFSNIPAPNTGNNAKDTWDFLVGNGFTPEAAAGVMGNLQQESSLDPLATEYSEYSGWNTLADIGKRCGGR